MEKVIVYNDKGTSVIFDTVEQAAKAVKRSPAIIKLMIESGNVLEGKTFDVIDVEEGEE